MLNSQAFYVGFRYYQDGVERIISYPTTHCCLCYSPSPYLSVPVVFSSCALVGTRAAGANFVQDYGRGVIQTCDVSHRYRQGVTCMCVAESPVRGVLSKPVRKPGWLCVFNLVLFLCASQLKLNEPVPAAAASAVSAHVKLSELNFTFVVSIPAFYAEGQRNFRMKRAFPVYLSCPYKIRPAPSILHQYFSILSFRVSTFNLFPWLNLKPQVLPFDLLLNSILKTPTSPPPFPNPVTIPPWSTAPLRRLTTFTPWRRPSRTRAVSRSNSAGAGRLRLRTTSAWMRHDSSRRKWRWTLATTMSPLLDRSQIPSPQSRRPRPRTRPRTRPRMSWDV